MIYVKENINNVDEFNMLYDLVGWGAYSKEISQKAEFDKNRAKLDAKLRELGIYPESTDEEAKEYLQAIMRGR